MSPCRKPRSIFPTRTRATLVTGAACLLMAALISTAVVYRERDRLLAETGRRLAATAQTMAERLDDGLQAWARDVAALARFATFEQEPADAAAARRLLEDLRARSPEFSWIGFTGEDARVIAATGRMLEGADVSARPWFAGGRRGLFLGDVHPAILLARLLPPEEGGENASFVDAAAPVRRADGSVRGVVAGHLNWRWAEGVRQEVLRGTRSAGTPELLVLGRDGSVLLGQPAGAGSGQEPEIAAQARSGSTGGWLLGDGRHLLTGFAPTRGTPEHSGLGWVVLAQEQTATALAPLWPLGLWLALGALGVAVTAGWLAGRVVGRLGTALRALNDGPHGRNATEELERVAARMQSLRDTAYRDPLTGLFNRAGFAAWRAAHPRAEHDCAVLALDLDGFKPVNDRLGHAAGDEVLVAIGRWLTDNLRADDCAVRTGGDEFVLCLQGPASVIETAATEAAARFKTALTRGLPTPYGTLALGCSIGIAIVPRDAPDIDTGIAFADAALYRAKRAAPGRRERTAPEPEQVD